MVALVSNMLRGLYDYVQAQVNERSWASVIRRCLVNVS